MPDLTKVHQRALARFGRLYKSVNSDRRASLEDRRFYTIAGSQWEGELKEQFENKPRFEFNKVHLGVLRIINEYRNNRITVDFVNSLSSTDNTLSDMLDGLFRANENDSNAEEAYDNAFEEAVGGGFGAFRLRNVFEDEESEDDMEQTLRIEPIFDADTCVFFDLDARRQDKSDAKYCYVLTAITTEDYKEKYDDDPASWPKEINSLGFDWNTPDIIYLAEYYEVVDETKTVYVFETLSGEEEKYTDVDFENDPDLYRMLEATKTKKIREKKVKIQKVHKYLMSGSKVLEDQGIIAGKYIPIIPVYGKRWYIESVERFMGHVRLCKDAQRLKNMLASKLGEIAALSPVEKPIFSPEQMEGHEYLWSMDNITNYPYTLINILEDKDGNPILTGPLGYTKPPAVPPTLAALLQFVEIDLKELLGNQQQGEEVVSHLSGALMELVQNKLDMQSYIYISNFARALKWAGTVWLEMAKEIYVESGRKLKILTDDKVADVIKLNEPVLVDGKQVMKNDISNSKMTIAVGVGPASSSRRQATLKAITFMMQNTQDPEAQQVLSYMAMLNMDGEGVDDIRQYFRKKLIQIGAAKPNDQEKREMELAAKNAKPDPNTLFVLASAKEAEAKATKMAVDADLNRAKIIEILSEIDNQELTIAMNVLQTIEQQKQKQAPAQPAQQG